MRDNLFDIPEINIRLQVILSSPLKIIFKFNCYIWSLRIFKKAFKGKWNLEKKHTLFGGGFKKWRVAQEWCSDAGA